MQKIYKLLSCLVGLCTLCSCSNSKSNLVVKEDVFNVTNLRCSHSTFCNNLKDTKETVRIFFQIESNFEYEIKNLKILDWNLGKIEYKNLQKNYWDFGNYSFEITIPNEAVHLSLKLQEVQYTKTKTGENFIYYGTDLLLKLDGRICSNSSNTNYYSYDDCKNLKIKFDDIFNQSESQYLVYFYADDSPHCFYATLEHTVSKYALDGQIKVYFVNAKQYSKPNEIMNDYNLASSEEEARASVGASSIKDFKFYGFPSMYFIKEEGENIAENANSTKRIEGVYIGIEEIISALKYYQ